MIWSASFPSTLSDLATRLPAPTPVPGVVDTVEASVQRADGSEAGARRHSCASCLGDCSPGAAPRSVGIRASMPTPTTCRPWRKTIGGAPLGRRLGDRKAPMGQPDAVLGPTRGSVPSGPPRATPPVAPARPVGGAEHGRQVRGPGRPRLPAPAIGGGPPVPGQYPGGPLADGSGLPGQLRAEACRGDRHRSARGGAPGVVQLGEVGAKVTSWSHGRRARCPAAAGRWHRPPRVRADGSPRAGAAVCVGRPIAPSPGSILPAGNQARLTSRR